MIDATDALAALETELHGLEAVIRNEQPEQAMEAIKAVGGAFNEVDGASHIGSKISKTRRALKGKTQTRGKRWPCSTRPKICSPWRCPGAGKPASAWRPISSDYDDAIKETIGVRLQKRLTTEQAEAVASCQSDHKDISLNF